MNTNEHANQYSAGKAYLVGAGPGRADLITVRGYRLLQTADVVIYDRLIAQELLDEIRPNAEKIFVGKQPGSHAMPQETINHHLVTRVREGKQVVRLKGGDSFVFGRGGEELLALATAQLPFEVVPGITSAIAAPAFAGVPVTQRGVNTSFAVITGHEDPAKPHTMTDWAALAQIPTLVILMGVGRIEAICEAIINAGRSPETPAIAVSWATTNHQQSVLATLATLPRKIQANAIPSPAVVVVGEVAQYHARLNWFVPDGTAEGFITQTQR
ncbi:MAG: uroporphyrinogen-III C-methyltransferase [Chloroflexota bacterium]